MQGKSYAALQPGGVFAERCKDFTPRESQCEMAQSVETCLRDNGRIVLESGTGTGKTFAYLVPVLLSGKRSIISTNTRHLQEQIFHRDLPEVCKTLERKVNAVMLKGRQNYLCRYRLQRDAAQTDLADGETDGELERIKQWALTTQSGDIAEVGDISERSQVWRRVTSTADNCLGGKCPDYKKCFVMQARNEAMQADIVVVNHHLFFSDSSLKTEGFGELLPSTEAVIFDEAQSLPETASMFFGFSLSSFQLRDLLGEIAAAEKEEQSAADFAPAVKKLQGAIRKIQTEIKKPNPQSLHGDDIDKTRFNALQTALAQLERPLAQAASKGEMLNKCHQRCLQAQAQLDTWLAGERGLICWLEVTATGFRMHATPLNVSDHLGEIVNDFGRAWVFTSATLAVGDDFTPFTRQIGLTEYEVKQWHSPFNFAEHALLYQPSDMPQPNHPMYAQALAETILNTLRASRGRAFCLFTSHAMMKKVYALLDGKLEWPMLLQGDASKRELLQQFTAQKNAVLFGTASFWEGVDVKGESLSCVIMDKLPFAPPDDPVQKSRRQHCEQEGGNAFMEMQIPPAVITFKQGAGRLIRSESDKGVLVVCDPRVNGKPYGKTFLQSLPPMPRTDKLSEVVKFFKRAR